MCTFVVVADGSRSLLSNLGERCIPTSAVSPPGAGDSASQEHGDNLTSGFSSELEHLVAAGGDYGLCIWKCGVDGQVSSSAPILQVGGADGVSGIWQCNPLVNKSCSWIFS